MAGCASNSRSMHSGTPCPPPLAVVLEEEQQCKLEQARHGIRLLRPSVHNQCTVYMGTGTVYLTPRAHPTAMDRTVQDLLPAYDGKNMFKGAPGTYPPRFSRVVESQPGRCTQPP